MVRRRLRRDHGRADDARSPRTASRRTPPAHAADSVAADAGRPRVRARQGGPGRASSRSGGGRSMSVQRSIDEMRGRPRRPGSTPRAGRAGARPRGTPPVTRHRPASAWQHTMRFRPGTALPRPGVQGRGCSSSTPAPASPRACTATRTPRPRCPSIRATPGAATASSVSRRRRSRRRSLGRRTRRGRPQPTSATASRAARRRPAAPHPASGAPGTATSRRSPPPTSLENLAALDARDLAGRRRPDRRRLEPRASGSGLRRSRRLRARCDAGRTTIRDSGRRAGIWLAPFLVGSDTTSRASTPSGWSATPATTGARTWSGWTSPTRACATYLHEDAVAALRDLGIDYFKLDFLYAGAVPGQRHDGRRRGSRRTGRASQLIRDAVGPDAYLLGLRRADPAERRSRRRDAGLARHLPRGRRGRLRRGCADGCRWWRGPGSRAGSGSTTPTAWSPGRVRASARSGRDAVAAFGGLRVVLRPDRRARRLGARDHAPAARGCRTAATRSPIDVVAPRLDRPRSRCA